MVRGYTVIIPLQDRMLGVIQRNQEKMELLADPHDVAEAVGLAAIVIQDLKAKRIKVRMIVTTLTGLRVQLGSHAASGGRHRRVAHVYLRSAQRH